MPQFPRSLWTNSPSVGALVKAQGSHSPMVEPDLVPEADLVHPFKVTAFKDGNDIKVRVRAGTANNLVPTMSGTELDDSPAPTLTLAGNATHRVYLKAEIGATPVFFPDTLSVVTATSVQTDTNDEGYLLLGSVVVADGKVTAVNQYVYASQVVVRAKPGSATALWSWSSR